MKQTKPLLLVAITLVVAASSFFVARYLVAGGFPLPISPPNLLITLVSIAVVIVLLAAPIIRYKNNLRENKSPRPKRVDPFYAVRVLLLAKATSITGAIFFGWHAGILFFQLSGPVQVESALRLSGFGILASAFLVASGIAVERICRLPGEPPLPNNTDSVLS